jgi:endoglucanase
MRFDFSKGFVVKGSETGEFLREKLAFMGLTPKADTEVIVYWMPLMEKNAWNLISFQGAAYTDNAVLTVEPRPDSVLRVYMAFKPLSFPITVPPQDLKPFERKGFTLVEWGGSEVKR